MECSAVIPLYILNDNIIELSGLRNSVDNAWINDATVQVTLKNYAGGNVPGAVWPMAMDYVENSNAVYRAVLPADLELKDKLKYKAEVEADSGQRVAFWVVPVVAGYRGVYDETQVAT